MKCRPRRKAEQALFDVHHQIVDRGWPDLGGSQGWNRKTGAIGGVVSTAELPYHAPDSAAAAKTKESG